MRTGVFVVSVLSLASGVCACGEDTGLLAGVAERAVEPGAEAAAEPPPPAGPAGLPAESVVRLPEPCLMPPAGATRCDRYMVTCGGLAGRVAEVATYAGVGAPHGAVIFGSGSAGAGFYDFQARETLTAAGYTVMERRWVGGWFQGATEGPPQGSCGLGALIRHVRAALPAALPLCATGNSGGSVELGYALTWHHAADSLDFALPTSGPFHRLDLACQGESDPTWMDRCAELKADLCPTCASDICEVTGPRDYIDVSYDHVTRCTAPGAGDLALLRDDSPLYGPSVGELAGFRIGVLVGELDPGAYLPLAGAFSAALLDAGADVHFDTVPGAGHAMDDFPTGAEAIADAILAGCHPSM